MAIEVFCDKCGVELKEKGAIIFGPPFKVDAFDVCDKYHICVNCWDWFVKITEKKEVKKKKSK